jgi:hypothetical protein
MTGAVAGHTAPLLLEDSQPNVVDDPLGPYSDCMRERAYRYLCWSGSFCTLLRVSNDTLIRSHRAYAKNRQCRIKEAADVWHDRGAIYYQGIR